jgi:hypothetical protein
MIETIVDQLSLILQSYLLTCLLAPSEPTTSQKKEQDIIDLTEDTSSDEDEGSDDDDDEEEDDDDDDNSMDTDITNYGLVKYNTHCIDDVAVDFNIIIITNNLFIITLFAQDDKILQEVLRVMYWLSKSANCLNRIFKICWFCFK